MDIDCDLIISLAFRYVCRNVPNLELDCFILSPSPYISMLACLYFCGFALFGLSSGSVHSPPLSPSRMQFLASENGKFYYNNILRAEQEYFALLGVEHLSDTMIEHLREATMLSIVADAWIGPGDEPGFINEFAKTLVSHSFQEKRSEMYFSNSDFQKILRENRETICDACSQDIGIEQLWRDIHEYRQVGFTMICSEGKTGK